MAHFWNIRFSGKRKAGGLVFEGVSRRLSHFSRIIHKASGGDRGSLSQSDPANRWFRLEPIFPGQSTRFADVLLWTARHELITVTRSFQADVAIGTGFKNNPTPPSKSCQ